MQETKALISAMTAETRDGPRAAASGCGFMVSELFCYFENSRKLIVMKTIVAHVMQVSFFR